VCFKISLPFQIIRSPRHHVDPLVNARIIGEKALLQWTFEALALATVCLSKGVRVFYRAYCADDVGQIISDSSKRYAKSADVSDNPMKDIDQGIYMDGW